MREIPLVLYYVMVGVMWLFSLALFISHFDKEKNKILSEKDKSIKYMPGRAFEMEIADAFEQIGWKSELGPWIADNGIDIEIKKDGKIYLIQCKHWFLDRRVRSKHIREFDGAIHRYNVKNHVKAKGIFITKGATTLPARETADIVGIRLWDMVNKWEYNVKRFEG